MRKRDDEIVLCTECGYSVYDCDRRTREWFKNVIEFTRTKLNTELSNASKDLPMVATTEEVVVESPVEPVNWIGVGADHGAICFCAECFERK